MAATDPAEFIDDRPREGVFRVHKAVFRDLAIHELELARIFESTWVFAGLASQAPRPHDFFTVQIGRHPVLVMRNAAGELGAFINSCRHRGARLCVLGSGNKRRHACPYHGWTYDSAGKLWNLKDKKEAAYPAAFEEEDVDLARTPRFDAYRGFLFVSFSADVPPLEEHLGDSKVFIDLLCDQSPVGKVELVPGRSTYVYEGNWKLQLENCTDAYHVLSTHTSYLRILQRRAEAQDHQVSKTIFGDEAPVWDDKDASCGSLDMGRGIVATWLSNRPQPSMPLHAAHGEVARRVTPERLKWMYRIRNATFFPNMQLACNASSQLRVIRPLGPDRTEMNTYCIAPVGEAAEARTQRLRQYEDFFNPTGVASPDDNAVYEDCQVGNRSDLANWHLGYMRGAKAIGKSVNSVGELGVDPVSYVEGPYLMQDETVFQGLYREWRRLMTASPQAPATCSTVEFAA